MKNDAIKQVVADLLDNKPDVIGMVIVIQSAPNGTGERIALHGNLSRITMLGHLEVIKSELIAQYTTNSQHIIQRP